MHNLQNPRRRSVMRVLASAAVSGLAPAWAQQSKSTANPRQITIAQIVDTSARQIDVSKDFLVGSRAAWQDINARGGILGRTVNHWVIEVDGTATSMRAAVDMLKGRTQCLAAFGTVGDRAASQLAGMLGTELPELAHVAPWLQNVEAQAASNTLPIFASRQVQIAHAIKSLSVMGVSQVGAVYGSAAEYAAYGEGLSTIARSLKLLFTDYKPVTDLQTLGQSLTQNSPRILLFIGGTPELVRFSQALEKQAAQRYIVAMSDVNLQSVQQMGVARFAPVIATQVVPMVNSGVPIVKTYRETLSRLFDEPPTPHSLAGFIAARYTYEVMKRMDGTPTRLGIVQAFQQRNTIDLGGFHISPDAQNRGSAYVTQSMISSDGRLVG